MATPNGYAAAGMIYCVDTKDLIDVIAFQI
jgi:hypothetical protein